MADQRARQGLLARIGGHPFRATERWAKGRRLGRSPRLQRLLRTAGASSRVREPLRFAFRELRGRPRTDVYRLREDGLKVVNRHPLLDMWTLEEVMRMRVYEFPPALVGRLSILGRPPRVVDLGGHVGTFGLYALSQFPAARLVSFEPDPRNAEVLAQCISANGKEGDWELVRACAATTDGEVDFISGFQLSGLASKRDAMSHERQEIETLFPFLRDTELLTEAQELRVPARDVFPYLADADLIKMDIEGAEWDLLADRRFSGLNALGVVLEYHGAACPEPDPDAYATRLLTEAGYEVGPVIPGAAGEAVMWGVRSKAPGAP